MKSLLKNKLSVSTLLLTQLFNYSYATDGGQWEYKGEYGPASWGEHYIMCKQGRNQSPIDIKDSINTNLAPVKFNYNILASTIKNNGHTIQVDYPAGNNITLSGNQYELKQFHFHSPSENTIDGKHFPLEAHFVHADSKGNLAVVGVMFKNGDANQKLAELWQAMPNQANTKQNLAKPFNATDLLPKSHEYYRFNGSLTTPPCSEGVLWLVLKQPITISQKQARQLVKTLKQSNNRPVQPLNARTILE
ncbi:carbonic anhydrase family protein [Endozoicomonas sp. SM1973]|uniref:Carbonic anhydrase n=1 Tax=Spartinivicinus marinus TaxID=2994442 RepID=A0A853IAD8_9GAMM|nr:carbonic anhydrase family protein [Spartinivicinus marinus]MCX4026440.1 carbonic anhydrase family protein [Spartinivicinus marinus]NYZ66811.1 carbonic anhydrase family protein [Spartinivicinus marinus]